MSLFSKIFARQDVQRSPHAGYFLLFLLTVFIAACDFLVFLPFKFGLPQFLHFTAIVLPLVSWALLLKFSRPVAQKIVPVVVFLLLFALWSYQIILAMSILYSLQASCCC